MNLFQFFYPTLETFFFIETFSDKFTINFVSYTILLGSPFKSNVISVVDPSKCFAQGRVFNTGNFIEISLGPGLETGIAEDSPTWFSIHLRDKRDQGLHSDQLQVKINDAKGLQVESQVKSSGDIGDYKVEYTPTDIGKHTIVLVNESQSIAKSPYEVNVKAVVDMSKTCIEGKERSIDKI